MTTIPNLNPLPAVTGDDLLITHDITTNRSGRVSATSVRDFVISTLELEDSNITTVNIKTLVGAGNPTATNWRSVIYGQAKLVFIPAGYQVRCNFLPDDDVRKFVGYGDILTQDQWGHEHIFSVDKMISGPDFSPKQKIAQAARMLSGPALRIGAIGDSITDGAWGDGFEAGGNQPVDGSGNLNSTNYNHNTTGGGVGSWFAHCIRSLVDLCGDTPSHDRELYFGWNAASSGKKLFDGWAYRNFDYGFFQNTAYENKAPQVLFVSMGVNDTALVFSSAHFDTYLDQFDKLIRKAWGYGSTVAFVSLQWMRNDWSLNEQAIKLSLEKKYPNTDVISAGAMLREFGTSMVGNNFYDAWRHTEAGSPVHDLLHPAGYGHRLIGGYVASQFFSTKVVTAKNGLNALPNFTYTIGYDELYPEGINIVGILDYLAPNQSWPLMNRNAAPEDLNMRFFVWCDDPTLVFNVLQPSPPTRTAANYNDQIKVWAGNTTVSPVTFNLASNGRTAYDTNAGTPDIRPLVTYGERLYLGLNIIDVIYDGTISSTIMPLLCIRKLVNNVSFGPVTKTLGIGTFYPTPLSNRGLAGVSPISYPEMNFNGTQNIDVLPDAYPVTGTAFIQTVHVASAALGAGVIGLYKHMTGDGILVARDPVVTTQVNIHSVIKGIKTLVGTVTGTFTSSFIVKFAQKDTEIQIDVYDSALAKTTTSTTGKPVTGGSVGLANTNGSATALISVYGASIDITDYRGGTLLM